MGSLFSLAKGLGIGTGLMYLFDPVAGPRRRSLLRDQVVALGNDLEDFVDHGVRDLSNRLSGMAARVSGRFHVHDTTDSVLADRVRSVMGRYVTHPRAIEVSVADGCIILTGPILASEVQPFVRAVETVRGVAKVENNLEVHQTADIPTLEGGRPLAARQNYSPGARLVAGVVGLSLLPAVARGTVAGALFGGIGLGLLAGSAMSRQSRTNASTHQPRRAPQQPGQTTGQSEKPPRHSDGMQRETEPAQSRQAGL